MLLIAFLGIHPKEMMKRMPTNLHTEVHGSFIHNCKTRKQPRCPPGGDGYTAAHLDNGSYSMLNRNELTSHEKVTQKTSAYC